MSQRGPAVADVPVEATHKMTQHTEVQQNNHGGQPQCNKSVLRAGNLHAIPLPNLNQNPRPQTNFEVSSLTNSASTTAWGCRHKAMLMLVRGLAFLRWAGTHRNPEKSIWISLALSLSPSLFLSLMSMDIAHRLWFESVVVCEKQTAWMQCLGASFIHRSKLMPSFHPTSPQMPQMDELQQPPSGIDSPDSIWIPCQHTNGAYPALEQGANPTTYTTCYDIYIYIWAAYVQHIIYTW